MVQNVPWFVRARLKTRQLMLLIAIDEEGNIHRAAETLAMSQPAASKLLKDLEEMMGVPLFERLPRGMRLTPSGDALITLARRWLQDERGVIAEIRRVQGVHQGHVALVAMDSHATSVMPALVREVAAQHPLVSLSIELATPDDAEAALLTGQADLAAIFNLKPRRELLVLWKSALPLGCVVAPGHPLAQRDTVSFQQATVYPVALQSKALTIRRYLEAQYNWLFKEPRRFTESNSLQLVKQLALAGQHVVFTSELDVAAELAAGQLVFIPVRDRGAEPQEIAVAVDATKPLGPIVKLVSQRLIEVLQDCLEAARSQAGPGARANEQAPAA